MRFTVKAKLASAFGAVIILSMVTGGLAYVKLNQLAATSADLVARAGRLDKANDIQTDILYQVRAEKNVIIATSDADIAKFAAELKSRREAAQHTQADVTAAASEAGKVLLGKFAVAYEKMNAIQDEVVKFGTLNSNARAADFWSGDGVATIKGLDAAVDAAIASVNRLPASIETGRALLALQALRPRRRVA